MFTSTKDHIAYIKGNYPDVTPQNAASNNWPIFCTNCKMVCGFQITETALAKQPGDSAYIAMSDALSPIAIWFRCPVCRAHKQWITYRISEPEGDLRVLTMVTRYYRVASLPCDGSEDISELPTEPPALRAAYQEAVRSMDANAHMAAAAMFRRAVQVITRNILKAKPSTLGNELKEVVGKKFNGVTIERNFAEIGFIIKEAGNPDRDEDLLDFTPQDAQDLQTIFMELVAELFVVPAAIRTTKDNFSKRRKLT